MKRALKIIIPILLALVVLGSIIWYLLVYDPAFTRDVLLTQARRLEGKGNHTAAAFFYDLAYKQSSGSEDVAIELAEQFISIGNYTKAEFTLSNAIIDSPSVKLYTALCKTYVKQDKLLDAVTMLENVADPAIKAELDAMRPAAPKVTPEPRFYTQYIQVTLEVPSGTVYYNIDGEYPSINSVPYAEPITLDVGETTIYALNVGSNGLVSPLMVFGYTVGGVVEPVTFADSAVEAALRSALNMNESSSIYTNDLWSITSFEMPADAQVYDDLAYLPYLEELIIHDGEGNLSVLSQLATLESLDLTGCRPTADDMAAIGSLTNLKTLILEDCGLSTIASLEKLTGLVMLDLDDNTIRNLSVISRMKELRELYLSHNAVVELTALDGMTSLRVLDVSYNSLTGLDAISSCSGLVELNASNNAVTSLSGLNKLNNLTKFDISYNQIMEVTQLSGLSAMQELNLSNNTIADITTLSTLVKLTEFDFSSNAVIALPDWSSDCALIRINGSNNQIATLDPLSGMRYLNHVYMDYNLLTSIEPLLGCPALIRVDVYGNEVTDASLLEDLDIKVNYNPL